MQKNSGRTGKKNELKIKKAIWELRGEGYEVPFIIAKVGCSKNTGYKYSGEYDEQTFTDNTIDTSNILSRVFYDCDNQVYDLHTYFEKKQKQAESYITKNKEVPKHLDLLMFEILKEIGNIRERKWNILGGRNGKNFKEKKDGKQK